MRKLRFNESPKDKNFWNYKLWLALQEVCKGEMNGYKRYRRDDLWWIGKRNNGGDFLLIMTNRQINISIDADLMNLSYIEFCEAAKSIGEYYYNPKMI